MLDTLQGRSTLVIRQVARTLRTSCWNEIGKAAARLGLTGCFRFNKTEMTVTARNNGAQLLFAGWTMWKRSNPSPPPAAR